jgi:hypothetical protein
MADLTINGATAPGAGTPTNEGGPDAANVRAPADTKKQWFDYRQAGRLRKSLRDLALLVVTALVVVAVLAGIRGAA